MERDIGLDNGGGVFPPGWVIVVPLLPPPQPEARNIAARRNVKGTGQQLFEKNMKRRLQLQTEVLALSIAQNRNILYLFRSAQGLPCFLFESGEPWVQEVVTGPSFKRSKAMFAGRNRVECSGELPARNAGPSSS